LTTRDRYGLAQLAPDDLADPDLDDIDLDNVLFQILEPHEIARAMAFEDNYQVAAKSKRIKVRLYGNAVTPPVAELIGCALVEAITGEPIEHAMAA
jgi:DNA (cytosine-5)-methyltransferase 1